MQVDMAGISHMQLPFRKHLSLLTLSCPRPHLYHLALMYSLSLDGIPTRMFMTTLPSEEAELALMDSPLSGQVSITTAVRGGQPCQRHLLVSCATKPADGVLWCARMATSGFLICIGLMTLRISSPQSKKS